MDWTNKQIKILSPQTDVLVQDLVDFIRTEEAGNTGITFDQIVQATGKDSLGGVVSTGVTCNLLDNWQLKFWDGSYVATISGGNLIGGIAGDPVAYTAGVQVVIIQSAASTIVISGSGITQQDKDDIIDGVWDEAISGHIDSNTFGRLLSDVLQDTGTTIPALISAVDGKIETIDTMVEVIEKLTGNNVTKTGDVITIYDSDGVTPWRQYNLANGGRVQQ
jgi:hypothetical protein